MGGAMPPAGAPPQMQQPPGQPPFGSSPASAATENAGRAAQGRELAGAALKIIYMALAVIPPADPLHQALHKAAGDIGKHAAEGGPVGDRNALDALRIQQQKMAPAQAQAQQHVAQGLAMPQQAPQPAPQPQMGVGA